MLLAEDQVFKHMHLWDTVHIQTTAAAQSKEQLAERVERSILTHCVGDFSPLVAVSVSLDLCGGVHHDRTYWSTLLTLW